MEVQEATMEGRHVQIATHDAVLTGVLSVPPAATGVVVFVQGSPNSAMSPRNVTVATHTFHLDPTHHVPVPPELLRFVAEARGWRDVEVRGLHAPESLRVAEDTETARRLNDAFYGPFDYALVARAPAA